ncbi:hypothetical protein PAXRUDRAFT_830758 [Paxillus rubicundulus Ve08.2h10]|uniref:Uncharacterized protein n=1 Tax=Paxillus rubicundulus Ve08.2h10 TaxID=930991 RepID=A0A0D0E3E8_9AGAM|nr:hypothetical protein PAXRUDRAFT_830758 [Paxillus rubicundulus Ve08.2h10]
MQRTRVEKKVAGDEQAHGGQQEDSRALPTTVPTVQSSSLGTDNPPGTFLPHPRVSLLLQRYCAMDLFNNTPPFSWILIKVTTNGSRRTTMRRTRTIDKTQTRPQGHIHALTTIAHRVPVSIPCQTTCPQRPAYTHATHLPTQTPHSCIRYVNYLSPTTTASQGTASAGLWLIRTPAVRIRFDASSCTLCSHPKRRPKRVICHPNDPLVTGTAMNGTYKVTLMYWHYQPCPYT